MPPFKLNDRWFSISPICTTDDGAEQFMLPSIKIFSFANTSTFVFISKEEAFEISIMSPQSNRILFPCIMPHDKIFTFALSSISPLEAKLEPSLSAIWPIDEDNSIESDLILPANSIKYVVFFFFFFGLSTASASLLI